MNYFDQLCESIFGYIPKGKGKSYELFVNCVLQHLNSRSTVESDTYCKSSYSEDKYQLDGLLVEEYTLVKTFIESKNYLDRGGTVGRGDIQKLSGALQVLNNFDKGIVASATDFTKPAKQYPKDLHMAGYKPIDLYVIRPIKEEDIEGLILKINVEGLLHIPDLEITDITWGEKGRLKLQEMGYQAGDNFSINLEYIYNSSGERIIELNNFAQKSKVRGDNFWQFDHNSYLLIDSNLVPFEKIHYNLTYSKTPLKIEVSFDPVIYVRSDDGAIKKLIDTNALKKAYQQLKK